MHTKCDASACPVQLTLSLIANKWSVRILYALFQAKDGVMRFNELRRNLSVITQRELSRQLKEFETAGIVARKVYPVMPPMVEYSLTPLGKSLSQPIESLSDWAEKNGEKVKRNRLKHQRAS
jgi:DNA-binding HxlR family transcriptional regulator